MLYSKCKVRERIQKGKILLRVASLERFGCQIGNRSAGARAGGLSDGPACPGLGAAREDAAEMGESSLEM